jgi:hypothetical protein
MLSFETIQAEQNKAKAHTKKNHLIRSTTIYEMFIAKEILLLLLLNPLTVCLHIAHINMKMRKCTPSVNEVLKEAHTEEEITRVVERKKKKASTQ